MRYFQFRRYFDPTYNIINHIKVVKIKGVEVIEGNALIKSY